MSEFMDVSVAAAKAAGKVLLDWRGKITAREKGPKDLVTEADLQSQKTIREIVLTAFPDHDFLGEEDEDLGGHLDSGSPYRWIVDPLDGTANYVHGMAEFSVSIALQHEHQTVVGVIYDPVSGELFSAERGQGTFLEGERQSVSDCQQLEKAMIAASFPANVGRNSIEVARFVEVLARSQVMRRLGSAALNLCYVASGRLDGYWATSVKLWDVAAGLLFVEESGGSVTNLEGQAFDPHKPLFVASANPVLHEQFIRAISESEQLFQSWQ
jgi:myo-inositol-1(or 4)-monophosphatase